MMTLNTPGLWGAGNQIQGCIHARQALPTEQHHQPKTGVLDVAVNRENPPPGQDWNVEMKLCEMLKMCLLWRKVEFVCFFFFLNSSCDDLHSV